jgi:hypothetical protein
MRLILLLCGLICSWHSFGYALKEFWQPDALIIGAQKSGTTPLYKFISQHPNIVYKDNEVHFFDINYQKGVHWYQSQFPKRTKDHFFIVDKSPYYILHPKVPELVDATYPDVKIIMILRNPVDRAYSQYMMNISSGQEPLSFEGALNAEDKRLAGEEEKLFTIPYYNSDQFRKFSYKTRGIYVTQIKRWLKFFPREQLLILKNEDLRENPDEVMEQVFAFLGLPHFFPTQPREDNHSTYPPMSPETRKRLAKFFHPYNQQLEELLGMKFNWE